MNIREDNVNELIEELSDLKKRLVEEQVNIIESYITCGLSDEEDGVLNMLESYLSDRCISIGSTTYNSRMNFGIDSTIVAIEKILEELRGTEENLPIAKKFAQKAQPVIEEKIEYQISQVITIVREACKVETNNYIVSEKITEAIRTIKINRRPFDNSIINGKAIKETTEYVKKYLYNISKNAMHYMYRGNNISAQVENFNAQLTDANSLKSLNNILDQEDENLIIKVYNICGLYGEQNYYIQSESSDVKSYKSIIDNILFNEDASLVEIKL